MEVVKLTTGRKFLFVTDTHLRVTPFSTMPNFLEVQHKMLVELSRKIKENNITDLVLCGDLVDRGIASKEDYLKIVMIVKRVKSLVDNIFMCIGNHMYLDILNQPEVFLIQPTDRIKFLQGIPEEEKVIETPDIIRCGGLQINLAHYNKQGDHTAYYFLRDKDTVQNVSVFHDDLYGHHNSVLPQKIQDIYDGVDIAVHGHIHIKHDPLLHKVNGKDVMVYIPGSMALTSTAQDEYHTDVDLPVIEVTEDGQIINSILNIDIQTRYLRISKEATTEEIKSLNKFKKAFDINTVEINNLIDNFEDIDNQLDECDLSESLEHLTQAEELAKLKTDKVSLTNLFSFLDSVQCPQNIIDLIEEAMFSVVDFEGYIKGICNNDNKL